MSEALVPAAEPVVVADGETDVVVLPALIVDAGPDAVARFLEFFAGRIATWPPTSGPTPGRSRPSSSTWPPSACSATGSSSTRSSGVNPAAAVRGPKHVVTKGATPVLTPAEARKLLEHIDTGTLAGLRDRGLFSVMLYSFARVSAVLGMRRQDYFRQGSRGWLRLHEKGGKRHDVPAHHRAAEALDEYLDACGLEAAGEALF